MIHGAVTYNFHYGDYTNNGQQTVYTYSMIDGFPLGTNLFGTTMQKLPVSMTTGGKKTTFSYTYDGNGNIATQKVTQGSETMTLTYSYY